MTDHNHLIGQTLLFDTAAVPWHDLFLDELNRSLEEQTPALSSLSDLHEHYDEQSLAPLYRRFYRLMDEEPFRTSYRALIETVVAPLFSGPFRFQRKPGIRIHLPNVLTVQFHTDEWYGHGPDVINFWAPLTTAGDTSTLHVASLADSRREVDRLERQKATMQTINTDLARIVQPLQSRFGHLHVFGAQCVHGSFPNRTGRTRVSIDFRLLPAGADPGLKPIDEYYTTLAPGDDDPVDRAIPDGGYRACSYLFGAHGFTRHLGTTYQRLICAEFARSQGITLLAEETEIRTMPHHPTLLSLAEGSGANRFNALVLFSLFCLPADPADRRTIYHTALQRSVTLFFAAERLRVTTAADADQIERHWHQRNAAA